MFSFSLGGNQDAMLSSVSSSEVWWMKSQSDEGMSSHASLRSDFLFFHALFVCVSV